MARYTNAKCKLCRREGERLYLRGPRCHSVKCAIARRPNPPGAQSFRRRRTSDYGLQLREKQKAKRIYGVLERQFRRYYAMATRKKGNKGDNLMTILESRLDNVVFHAGFAESRCQARQMIRHGHVAVNGRRMSIPSYLVKPDTVVTATGGAKSTKLVANNLELTKGTPVPGWLACDPQRSEVKVLRLPSGPDEFSLPIQSNLIVELLAK